MSTLGDGPIEQNLREPMQEIAKGLDRIFNGEARGQDRQTGFVLLVFPFHGHEGRCNYISNGADRKDIIVLMKEQIKRFEGQADLKGTVQDSVLALKVPELVTQLRAELSEALAALERYQSIWQESLVDPRLGADARRILLKHRPVSLPTANSSSICCECGEPMARANPVCKYPGNHDVATFNARLAKHKDSSHDK